MLQSYKADLAHQLVVIVQLGYALVLHAVTVAQRAGKGGGSPQPADHGTVRRLLVGGVLVQGDHTGHVHLQVLVHLYSK